MSIDTKQRVRFLPVHSDEDVVKTAELAKVIWNEHYVPIIGQAQVDYMLSTIQSAPAIAEQIKSADYRYFLIEEAGEPAGYLGVQPEAGRLFVSKLYILAKFRGRGIAQTALRKSEEICGALGLSKIYLTVNRNNAGAIAAYEKMKFKKIAEQTADIGAGYIMDDYVMERACAGENGEIIVE